MIQPVKSRIIQCVVTEKACVRCGLTKPVSEFSKDRSKKDGLQCGCKDCQRKHYEANRAVVLEHQRQYRESNVDLVREQRRRYDATNTAARKEFVRKYREGGRPVDKPWPNQPIAYVTAHVRVRATYGPASNYPCIGCGGPAKHWAYDHTDPNPLMHRDTKGRWAGKPYPYSPDPQRYDPMCRSCHVKRDRFGTA